MAATISKDACKFFFTKPGNVPCCEGTSCNHWSCNRCDKKVTQNITKGYHNLISHLNTNHADWKSIYEKEKGGPASIRHYFKSTDKETNIFGWLDLLTSNCMLPFSIVEDQTMLKYMKLKEMDKGRNFIF